MFAFGDVVENVSNGDKKNMVWNTGRFDFRGVGGRYYTQQLDAMQYQYICYSLQLYMVAI